MAKDLLQEAFAEAMAHRQAGRLPQAAEALRRAVALRPDVLVSDIEMPGESGYALIQKVRALPPEAGGLTPAIALTAYARPDDRMQALTAGFQAHLAKPALPEDLAAAIASAVGWTRG